MRSGLITAMQRIREGHASLLIVGESASAEQSGSGMAYCDDSRATICGLLGCVSVVERLDSRTPDGLNRLKFGKRKQSTEFLSLGSDMSKGTKPQVVRAIGYCAREYRAAVRRRRESRRAQKIAGGTLHRARHSLGGDHRG